MSAALSFTQSGTRPRTAHPGVWLVRISPTSKRNTQVLRKHSLSFTKAGGWKRVQTTDRRLIGELLAVRLGAAINSPSVFDVCTVEEALQLDKLEMERERRDTGRRKSAREALGAEERELLEERGGALGRTDVMPPNRRAALGLHDPEPVAAPVSRRTIERIVEEQEAAASEADADDTTLDDDVDFGVDDELDEAV
jgi:hypothetical protein